MKRSLIAGMLSVFVVGSATLAGSAEVPAAVVGKWVTSTVSSTTYWGDNGQFIGNGSGSAQYYTFNADGTFEYFMYLEMRTGYYVNKVSTSCKGTVKFAAHKFTLHPVSGRYHTETGSTIKDRPMTEDDLKRMTKTSAWQMGKGSDGSPRFIVPFDDGSKFEFKPAEAPAEKQ